MQRILRLWLIILVFYVGGVMSAVLKIWPAPQLVETWFYLVDNRWDTRNVVERIYHDLGITPYRLLTRDGGSVADVEDLRPLDVAMLNDRREPPQVFLSPDRTPRLTFIYGVFDFSDGLYGAILLDQNAQVVRRWALREYPSLPDRRENPSLYPHGVLIDPDGSITYSFDFGSSVSKVDACGRPLWTLAERGDPPVPGDYNHSLHYDDDGLIWTTDGQIRSFLAIDADTGAVAKEILFSDVLKANLDRGFLLTRFDRYETGHVALADPFHANDVEPLTAELASAFPMFSPGDLLVSLRSLNLVFVMDPESLRVKWYSQGEMQIQHDPDFEADGSIVALDNRWFQPPSRLLAMDPAGGMSRTVLDGGPYDFTTGNRGKHQALDGGRLITSSKQGRVFETDATGRVVFEFINTWNSEKGLRALVSEAIALPVDYFGDLPVCD